MATNHPDLLTPGTVAPSVPPLQAITPPLGNTKQDSFRYFHCTMATASFHRPDGKKLPFINHFFRTDIAEDIRYLEDEIRLGNAYLRKATKEEVEHAKLIEDPLGTIKEAVRKELSIEDLEKLLAERKATQASGLSDAAKIAGVDPKQASAAIVAKGVNPLGAVSTAQLASMIKAKP